jgi:hypothetical protein
MIAGSWNTELRVFAESTEQGPKDMADRRLGSAAGRKPTEAEGVMHSQGETTDGETDKTTLEQVPMSLHCVIDSLRTRP